jgi:hypothetical protein
MFQFLSANFPEAFFSPITADYIGRVAVSLIAITFGLRLFLTDAARDRILSFFTYVFERRKGRISKTIVHLVHGDGTTHKALSSKRRHAHHH